MAQEAFNKFFIIKFLTTCPFCPGILPGLASMTEPLRGDGIYSKTNQLNYKQLTK